MRCAACHLGKFTVDVGTSIGAAILKRRIGKAAALRGSVRVVCGESRWP
jgi:hypothetical protein